MTRRAAVLACVGAALVGAPPALARDDSVTSFDGTHIALSFFPAEGLPEGERAPTVLVGHDWGTSRDTDQHSESSDASGYVGVGALRHDGYNVLTWDARGFGQSGGTAEGDSPDFEARDVQALVDYVARQPEALLDGPADPRVGMSGASYGGGVQLVSAALDHRIDAIVPDLAWNSLLTSFAKEGSPKVGAAHILFGLGVAGGTAPVPPTGGAASFDPQITSAYTGAAVTGHFTDQDIQWMAARGPGDALVSQVRAPTLLTQASSDTIFTLDEAVRNYAVLRKTGVPVKMMWLCAGNGACLTDTGTAGYLEHSVLLWLARWLKRDPNTNTGPGFEWLADDGVWRTSSAFPMPAAAPLTGKGSGTLPLVQGDTSGIPLAAVAAANAVNVAIQGPHATADLVGASSLELTYSGSANPPATFVYAQVVDLGGGRVLGNQVTPIPVTLDGAEHTIARPLEAVAAHAKPGAMYQLQLIGGTNVYGPQRSNGSVSFSAVQVRLPVASASAVSIAGGATPGGGKTRGKGRRVTLRIAQVGGRNRKVIRVVLSASERLSKVVVVLRNRRGRRLAGVRVKKVGRSTKLNLRLRRRPPVGRYRLVASGRAGDGVAARASRGLRLR